VRYVPSWLGYPQPQPDFGPRWTFLGARAIVAQIALASVLATFFWLGALFVLFLLRTLLRKEWAAAVAWVLLFTGFAVADSGLDPVALVGSVIFFGLAVIVMIRFGLLALVANFMVYDILQSFPLTLQGSSWYAGISLAGILLMAAITFYGFYTSLGGRPVFGGVALEE